MRLLRRDPIISFLRLPDRLEDVLWVFKGKSSDYKALSWKIQEPCLI